MHYLIQEELAVLIFFKVTLSWRPVLHETVHDMGRDLVSFVKGEGYCPLVLFDTVTDCSSPDSGGAGGAEAEAVWAGGREQATSHGAQDHSCPWNFAWWVRPGQGRRNWVFLCPFFVFVFVFRIKICLTALKKTAYENVNVIVACFKHSFSRICYILSSNWGMKYSDLMDTNLKTGTMGIYISLTFAVKKNPLSWGGGGKYFSFNFKTAVVI